MSFHGGGSHPPPASRPARGKDEASKGGGPRWGVDIKAQRRENAEAPNIPHLWRRVGALFRDYRGRLLATAILVVASAVVGIIPPLLIQRIFDDALFPADAFGPNLRLLSSLVALAIGLFIASALLGVWQTFLTSKVGNRVAGDLRENLFVRLQGMDLAFFTRTKTGVIQSRLQNDVGGVSGVLTSTVTNIVGNSVTVLASLAAMIVLDWRLTVIAVIVMPALVVVQRRVGQVRARIASATQESLSELTAITQETLSVSGILLSKSFNRQGLETERYATENRNQISLQVRQAMSGQWFFAMVMSIMSSVPAVIYLAAGFFISRDLDNAGIFAEGVASDASSSVVVGGLTAGTIVAFTAIQGRLIFPLMGLMRVALDVQTSRALFARIFEYMDLVPSIADAPDAKTIADAPGPVGQVEFRDVTFKYPDASKSSKATLSKVSFVAEPGQRIAFVGPSGAGKTTVLYLAPRLHEASGGSVMFSGADVRELTHQSVIENIGIVSQETYLFHATIAENLRYAKPDATDDELIAACKGANIHKAIMSFDDGYDTVVGERGYRLSGGEKQRVAIARVLLKDPPVLLLDEATSSLDTVSEKVVQSALDRASRGRTTITVAHRLSTIVDADMIHVVDAGAIVESGTHAQLMRKRGVYAELAAQQVDSANHAEG